MRTPFAPLESVALDPLSAPVGGATAFGSVGAIADRSHVAIAVFEAGWLPSPDRALLVDCTTWRIIAANPAARDELLEAHGIDLIGLEVDDMLAPDHDLVASRERWRTQTHADVTVRHHAYDPDRYVRIAIWALGEFNGDYLVVVARDIDLGLRAAWENAQPLLDLSNNLVAVASHDTIVFANARFSEQFGEAKSLARLFEQACSVETAHAARRAIAEARAGKPGRPFTAKLRMSDGRWASAEVAFAPAPQVTEAGVVLVMVPVASDAVEMPSTFNQRERDIVELMLRGHRIPSIAARLHLSHHTVRNHLRTIFAKCDVNSQRELVDHLRAGGV